MTSFSEVSDKIILYEALQLIAYRYSTIGLMLDVPDYVTENLKYEPISVDVRLLRVIEHWLDNASEADKRWYTILHMLESNAISNKLAAVI